MLLFIMVSGFKYVISYKSIRKIAYTFFKLNDETGEHIMTQGKKIAITSFISAVLFASKCICYRKETSMMENILISLIIDLSDSKQSGLHPGQI